MNLLLSCLFHSISSSTSTIASFHIRSLIISLICLNSLQFTNLFSAYSPFVSHPYRKCTKQLQPILCVPLFIQSSITAALPLFSFQPLTWMSSDWAITKLILLTYSWKIKNHLISSFQTKKKRKKIPKLKKNHVKKNDLIKEAKICY